jgi:hypothetical protein
VNRLEVLNDRGPSQVEHDFADADVARTPALPRGDVSKSMFNTGAQMYFRASWPSRLQHTELLLQALVCGNADSSALAVRRVRALRAKSARAANVWVELDDMSGFERLCLAQLGT